MPKLTFLGAAGTVTGSKYLVEAAGKRLLVDCGIFQGSDELSNRNYQLLPSDPKSFDFVVLTHAHLDHTGWLSQEHTTRMLTDALATGCSRPPRGGSAVPESLRVH